MRTCTTDDFPFVFALAKARYPAFDEYATAQWLWSVLQRSGEECCVVRNDSAVCVFEGYAPFYAPDKRRINIRFLVAEPNGKFAGLKLLKSVIEHCKALGYDDLLFAEETGARFDLLAKKIGARPFERTYQVDLRCPRT